MIDDELDDHLYHASRILRPNISLFDLKGYLVVVGANISGCEEHALLDAFNKYQRWLNDPQGFIQAMRTRSDRVYELESEDLTLQY